MQWHTHYEFPENIKNNKSASDMKVMALQYDCLWNAGRRMNEKDEKYQDIRMQDKNCSEHLSYNLK